jgi:hypothetical protein
MAILFLIILAFFIWKLIVQGLIWKIIVGAFGWVGMYVAIAEFLPELNNTYIIIGHNRISWAIMIPSFILMMAMLYSKND